MLAVSDSKRRAVSVVIGHLHVSSHNREARVRRAVGIDQKNYSVLWQNFGHGVLEYVKIKSLGCRRILALDLGYFYIPAAESLFLERPQHAAEKDV